MTETEILTKLKSMIKDDVDFLNDQLADMGRSEMKAKTPGQNQAQAASWCRELLTSPEWTKPRLIRKSPT